MIVALAPFYFYPPKFGGAERIYNLLSRLEHPVHVLYPDIQHHVEQLGNMTIESVLVDSDMANENINDWDIKLARHAIRLFRRRIVELNPKLVILEHPWQVEAIPKGTKFFYDAHNNETQLKLELFGQQIARAAEHYEKKALKADAIAYCSKDDDIDGYYIPNGTDLPNVTAGSGYKSKKLIFIGSGHPPNVQAAHNLAVWGRQLDYEIEIAGACSEVIDPDGNVKTLGRLQETDEFFRCAFAFVNLMEQGSGTSLKVIKALSYGLPVISTERGARGFSQDCIIVDSVEKLKLSLEKLQNKDEYLKQSLRSLKVAEEYGWDKIGKKFSEAVTNVYESR